MDTQLSNASPTLPLEVSQHRIEELLTLTDEELAALIQTNVEVVIDGALSEWGSKVEDLFRKLEKSVLVWHTPGVTQKITLVFA